MYDLFSKSFDRPQRTYATLRFCLVCVCVADIPGSMQLCAFEVSGDGCAVTVLNRMIQRVVMDALLLY